MNWQETVFMTLEERGYRMTAPRRVIIEHIAGLEGPFTAEELYELIKHRQSGVGRATVYRTLDLLLAQRWLARLHADDGVHAYIVSEPHHHRMVCTTCGAGITFEECEVDGLLNELARRNGFRIEGHWLEAFGLCKTCRPRETAPQRPVQKYHEP